jgi:Mg-chelatase subunit ChlD
MIEFGRSYYGRLPAGDTDVYGFFLEKSATVIFDYKVPAGGHFSMSHYMGESPELRRESLKGQSRLRYELPPGPHRFQISPPEVSPAEYNVRFSLQPPFVDDLAAVVEMESGVPTVKAFSQEPQRISLSDIPTLTFPSDGRLQVWSPAAKLSYDSGTKDIIIAPDLVTGDYPIWIASDDGSPILKILLNAHPNAPKIGTTEFSSIPPGMRGGVNVALASLGAKFLSQDGYELDEDGVLPRSNPANASNHGALIDGVKAFTTDGGWYSKLSTNSERVYRPTLDLPGENPIPLIGVGLTKRIGSLSGFESFSVATSLDGQVWNEVLSERLVTSDQRELFEFPGGPALAKFVRLTPALTERSSAPISLGEFEVFAQPGASGLQRMALLDKMKGALGRLTTDTWFSRNSQYGLDTVEDGYAIRSFGEDGFTDIQLVHTFKNQSIAEIEAIELFFGTVELTHQSKPMATATTVRLLGSVSGPMGPYNQQVDLEVPANFGLGGSVRLDLPERLIANAVKVEYFAEDNEKKPIQVPAYYELYERQDSANYVSVLGLSEEFRPRPYTLDSEGDVSPIAYTGEDSALPSNGTVHMGAIQLGKQVNQWIVTREGHSNTLILSARGERGFFPKVEVSTISGKELAQLSETENPIRRERIWRYDFAEDTLRITVSEPPRSTIFLMDQSPSAASYIDRARRSIIDYSEQMVEGEDRVLFGSFGSPLISEDWMLDPIKFRRALVEYTLTGNSSGEAAMAGAAEMFKGLSGTRTIVVFGDGDFDSDVNLMPELADNNVMVFPIKISSARIWGNPITSMAGMTQYANTSGGESAYIQKDQDITDAFSRVTARLLGEKSYTLTAEQDQRLIQPGQLSVRLDGTQSEGAKSGTQQQTAYHVLFDASGSMLKRTGGTRRINIAKSAVMKFANDKISDTQTISLRQFGGRPDQCDTELVLPIDQATKAEFISAIEAISPQNNAKTPIATALSQLPDDLADVNGPVQILLLTDGEETCDGDAGEVIDQLIASDIANRVDIVSFSLDADIDREPFENWAERGRGLYIDAQGGEGLTQALEQTVRETFNVISEDGEVILTALIGDDPVGLPTGMYQVNARDETYSVEIKSEETTELTIK